MPSSKRCKTCKKDSGSHDYCRACHDSYVAKNGKKCYTCGKDSGSRNHCLTCHDAFMAEKRGETKEERTCYTCGKSSGGYNFCRDCHHAYINGEYNEQEEKQEEEEEEKQEAASKPSVKACISLKKSSGKDMCQSEAARCLFCEGEVQGEREACLPCLGQREKILKAQLREDELDKTPYVEVRKEVSWVVKEQDKETHHSKVVSEFYLASPFLRGKRILRVGKDLKGDPKVMWFYGPSQQENMEDNILSIIPRQAVVFL